MAVYTNGTLSNSINREWDKNLLFARYATSTIMPRVLNKSSMLSRSGEIVSIDIEPAFTVGTVTAATGAFTPTNTAPTQINITVDQWKYASAEITRQAGKQSFYDPTKDFGTPAGKALAVQQDADLAALYSSVASANNVNPSDPQQFDDTLARISMLRLADANVPLDGLSWILHPAAFYTGLLASVGFSAAYATGLDKSTLITGQKTDILGVPIFITTVVATTTVGGTTVRKGMLLHREALGIATQLNHEYELASRVGAGFLADVAVVSDLYGTKVVRDDHFCVVTLLN